MLPTQNYFAFGGEDGGAVWTRPGYPEGTQQTGRGHPEGWDTKIRHFGGWLGQLEEFLDAIAEHSKRKTAAVTPPIASEARKLTGRRIWPDLGFRDLMTSNFYYWKSTRTVTSGSFRAKACWTSTRFD